MALITNGLYRIDLFQTYFTQQVINTFWYREQSGANDQAEELNLAFDALVIPALATMQNTDLSYDNLRCTPIFGTGIEDNRTPVAPAGLKVGTPMATFIAASIRLNRSTNELRNGWKRLVALTEEEVGAQSFAGVLNAELAAIGTLLDQNIIDGPMIFEPVIVRKPFSTKAQSPNWEFTAVGGFSVLNRPTTQNSRKQF